MLHPRFNIPLLVLAALCVTGCKPPEESQQKAIIGAILIDGTGGPPMSDSVVVVAGSRIRAVGNRTNMPIPAGVEKINGMGKFLVPGLIDLNARVGLNTNAYLASGITTLRVFGQHNPEPGGQSPDANLFLGATVQAKSPEDARSEVDTLANRQASAILIPLDAKPAVADAILDEARKFNIPVTAEIDSLAATERLVRSGAAGFLHMIQDTEDIDPAFVTRLRDLRIVFTPVLVATGPRDLLDRALRNAAKLAAGGVLIGTGSNSGRMQDELELLAQAGLLPMDVIVAATRTGAFALHKSDEMGTIEPNHYADLMLVTANPLEDVRNLRKIDRVMLHGEWVDREHLVLK